ncbi:MAG: hypothetical protein ACT4P0_05950 [Panacagrimonas sp.]
MPHAACLGALLGLFAAALPPAATAQEVEPNNSCATATDLGALTLPALVGGALASAGEQPNDVDFHRVSLTPGARVSFALQGDAAASAPLDNPVLGLFLNSGTGCNLEAYSDSFGSGSFGTARLSVTVPADGIVIAAASGYFDASFVGAHSQSGAYRLEIAEAVEATVRGRLINASTGAPLKSSSPQNARVDIIQCDSRGPFASCVTIESRSVGAEGRFRFPESSTQPPLRKGPIYRVAAIAFGFEDRVTEIEVTVNGEIDLGDLALTPIPVVRLVQVRLLEATSGIPISGSSPTFADVRLFHCDDEGRNCNFVRSGNPDGEGIVKFPGNNGQSLLRPGTYRIEAQSQEHPIKRGPTITLREGQTYRTPFRLRSQYPVRLSEIRPCGAPPVEGGSCAYSARITSISSAPIEGGAWSLVAGTQIGSPVNQTLFQTGVPQRFSLPPGGSTLANFEFEVPPDLNDGAVLCPEIHVGRGSGADSSLYFETIREAVLFCVRKGPSGQVSLSSPAEAKAAGEDMAARRAQAFPAPAAPP